MKAEDIVKLTIGQARAFVAILSPAIDTYQNDYLKTPIGSVKEREELAKRNKAYEIIHGMRLQAGLADEFARLESYREYRGMEIVWDARSKVIG